VAKSDGSGTAGDARKTMRLAGLGTALVGAALLLGAFFSYRRDVEREKALVAAPGTVVEQRERAHGSESRIVLTIRFTTASGDAVRFERSYGAHETPRPARGDTVTVLYDPARPGKAEIEDTSRLGLAVVGAVGGGLFLLGVGLLRWTIGHSRVTGGGPRSGGSGARRRR
jgi:hypothetical protein